MNSISQGIVEYEFDKDHPMLADRDVAPLSCDRWIASSALQKAIRRADVATAQRAARTLYRADSRNAWRRLLGIAVEDVGIGSIDAVIATASRSIDVKARRDHGGEEAAFLASCRILAQAPKDRSADLLFSAGMHSPFLEKARSTCAAMSLEERLEFIAEPTWTLPERAVAAWHASGVEPRGERRVGRGDFNALMRTYAKLGAPDKLLDAVAIAARKTREPMTVFPPLIWLEASKSETFIIDDPLPPSGSLNGVPLYALDKHTRAGRRAIRLFGQRNPRIACFARDHLRDCKNDGALRIAVFYAEGGLTRPSLRWDQSEELANLGVAADFLPVNTTAQIGVALINLVSENLAHLNDIRAELLSRDPLF